MWQSKIFCDTVQLIMISRHLEFPEKSETYWFKVLGNAVENYEFAFKGNKCAVFKKYTQILCLLCKFSIHL